MTFIHTSQRIIPGEGSKDAKICIIGEAGGAWEDKALRPFVGPAGGVLESCLHAAGIMRQECYITNVIKIHPKGNNIDPYYNSRTGNFTPAGQPWVNQLHEELKDVRSNVIIALGNIALSATTGHRSISKYRGYVLAGLPAIGGRKVVAAYHPAASLRGQYLLRYYISADFKKGKVESAFPEIRRPKRTIAIPQTIEECNQWLDMLDGCGKWACDIEVVNFEVSAMGFAPTQDLGISFPLYHNHWSLEQETYLWSRFNKLLTSGAIKVFQNGIFDIGFLADRCGIHVAGPIEDTMVAHHIQYPEMLKGLGFLVSLYCGSQQYYKDMVKFDNIKKEA